MASTIEMIKNQKWFYEFLLPDGTKTESYLPELARKVHSTREKALRSFLSSINCKSQNSLDVSCHEGYFSTILGEYFSTVLGVDKNPDSLDKAKLICECLGHTNISFTLDSVENLSPENSSDFVLCFGLLYHVENPIEIIRKLSLLSKKYLCIETQILPYEISGAIEDGSYMWQRNLHGLFGLCADYSHSKEGGLTDLALVPSKLGLDFLLKEFGFKSIRYYQPESEDYEQFVRNQRIILLAEK